MRKYVALLLIAAALLTLAACGSKDALAGTWSADLGEDGVITWTFNGKGKCTMENAYMKQNGAVLAKGWLLGAQFCALLEDGLYFRITAEADRLALRVKAAFAERSIPFHVDSPTNQQFVCLTDAQAEALGREFTFEEEGRTADGLRIARFCTSWATTEEEVDTLIAAIRAL